jgi:hypothetical protein
LHVERHTIYGFDAAFVGFANVINNEHKILEKFKKNTRYVKKYQMDYQMGYFYRMKFAKELLIYKTFSDFSQNLNKTFFLS